MPWRHLLTEVLPLLAVVSPLLGIITTVILRRWQPPMVRPMALSNTITTVLLIAAMIAVGRSENGSETNEVMRPTPASMSSLQRHSNAGHTFKNGGINVQLSLSADGLSAWSALVLSILVWTAISMPGQLRETLYASYCSWLLLTESLLLASLLTGDLMISLVLIESAIVPIYFLVGLYGDGNRRHAAGVLWMWQFAGGTCSLIGLTLLAVSRPWMQSDLVLKRGSLLFDATFLLENSQSLLMRSETAVHVWSGVAPWACLLMMIGFAIRLPTFPFHGWYESTLNAAPAGVAALIAFSLPVIALNGWMRLGAPMLSFDGSILTGLLGSFSIVGLWRAALVAYRQTNLRQLFATISAGLLCLACCGINTHHRDGIRGAWLLTLSQGLAVAIGILVTELLQKRFKTTDMSQLGSHVRNRPRLATVLVVALFGWASMPFLSGFAALSLIFSAYASAGVFPVISVIIALALLAAGSLRAMGACLFDLDKSTIADRASNLESYSSAESNAASLQSHFPRDSLLTPPTDLTRMELFTLIPLIVMLIGISVVPSAVLDNCEPAIRKMSTQGEQSSLQGSRGAFSQANLTYSP